MVILESTTILHDEGVNENVNTSNKSKRNPTTNKRKNQSSPNKHKPSSTKGHNNVPNEAPLSSPSPPTKSLVKKSKSNHSKSNSNKKNKKSTRVVTPLKQNNYTSSTTTLITPEEQSRYVALDCEMVGVGPHGLDSALARVCIIDWNKTILLDTYVQVNQEITDYRTFVSGIREEHLSKDVAMEFEECRSIVLELIRNKIVIGHGLKSDFYVLDIHHPWQDIRDTAKYEPFMKQVQLVPCDNASVSSSSSSSSSSQPLFRPRKLKELALNKLDRTIQISGHEHCPLEDAGAALDLYKKARSKWEKAVEYKVQKTKEIMNLQQKQQQRRDSISSVETSYSHGCIVS